MQEIDRRYAARACARFSRKTTLDADLRPGELDAAVSRAREGDPTALRYLYLRFADNVYGYARSIVGDEHEAEDVTQQVFARMITAIPRYESRGVPFSAWLLRIAHNMAIDHLRRQRAVPCEEPRVELHRADADEPLALTLRDALAELPPAQREVIVLRHVAGWSPAEIATRLQKTENAVHAMHHRGRRALQAALVRRDAAPAAAA